MFKNVYLIAVLMLITGCSSTTSEVVETKVVGACLPQQAMVYVCHAGGNKISIVLDKQINTVGRVKYNQPVDWDKVNLLVDARVISYNKVANEITFYFGLKSAIKKVGVKSYKTVSINPFPGSPVKRSFTYNGYTFRGAAKEVKYSGKYNAGYGEGASHTQLASGSSSYVPNTIKLKLTNGQNEHVIFVNHEIGTNISGNKPWRDTFVGGGFK